MQKSMKDTIMKNTFSIIKYLFFVSQASCSIFGVRTVEEVAFEVKKKDEEKEIRYYNDRVVAETVVTGSYKDSQRQAFRILANYIFGKNTKKEKIAMTAPVEHKKENEKISMTAPVMQKKDGKAWALEFSMPSKFKRIEDLPKPLDKRVKLKRKPGGYYAAISYSWWANEKKNQNKTNLLLKWLEKQTDFDVILPPSYAGYNPPWTIPFLRRHEIIIKLKKREG
ncbi:MAG: heme-binding protein [Zetaproteobacteria bacterium]|nr:heme-binding protein [Pseudobdellovibrionaceae bacterium]|tara:strand:+ start:436 stop:1107 length:672 start_codon:yes stop_codon:yes gene_type:complete